MSYAEVTAARGGSAPADRPPAAPTPLHHVAYLQGFAVLIDLRAVKPNLTKEERNQFLLQDLAVDIATVTDMFMVPSTQLLRVGFVAAEPCQAALDRLQAGVPWSAAGGAIVYGWAPSDSLSRLRVTGCTQALSIEWLVAHMAQYGQVVQSARGVDRSLGNVFDGVVHLTMQILPDAVLPSFIDLQDAGGHLAERLFVFTDQHRRRCFRCGHTGHVGQFCRASLRAPGAPPTPWSTLVLPASLSGQPVSGLGPDPPAAAAPPPSAPPPRAPVVPMPGGSTDPLPPTDERDRVYFGVEPPERSESSAAGSEPPPPSPPPSGRSRRVSVSTAPALPSGLPVAIKSKPAVAPPAQRGRQPAGKSRGGGAGAKTASHSSSPAAELLVGSAKVRGEATPPSQHISDSSQDGNGNS
jgi:hypothetical protein